MLRSVEHNQILYLPTGAISPGKVKSVGDGQEILADPVGMIELGDKDAAVMTSGQLEPLSVSSMEFKPSE